MFAKKMFSCKKKKKQNRMKLIWNNNWHLIIMTAMTIEILYFYDLDVICSNLHIRDKTPHQKSN